ncbi:hypothetical protein LTS10_009058 [Elasticomyces elasticus]|nr:hypothetical protein LTS10_009058 [Elasticomyces elasticus]
MFVNSHRAKGCTSAALLDFTSSFRAEDRTFTNSLTFNTSLDVSTVSHPNNTAVKSSEHQAVRPGHALHRRTTLHLNSLGITTHLCAHNDQQKPDFLQTQARKSQRTRPGNQRSMMIKTSDQSQCRLFTLPAELRNGIYELAFTVDMEEPIELLSAVPPANSLILTCRRVYDEAAGIYRGAYRAFWTVGHFRLTDDNDGRPVEAHTIVRSATRDWDRMCNIVVDCHDCTFNYLSEHGLWKYRSKQPEGGLHGMVVPYNASFGKMVLPENADATSLRPYVRLEYHYRDTLGEALKAAMKGRRGPMINQLCTLAA